jgi:Bacterial PH domain
VVRSRGHTAATGVLGLLVGGLLTLILAPLWGGAGTAGVVATGLAFAWFWIRRVVLAGVRVDAQGIRIVEPLRTHQVPWATIDRFEFGRFGPFLPKVAWVVLNSGDRVRIWAIQGSLLSMANASSRRLVDELNAARPGQALGRTVVP